MKIKLAYGLKGLDIELADDLNVRVVEPVYVEGFADQAGAVRDALLAPIASKPLKELVKPSEKVGIVFNDITRATPYDIILPHTILFCRSCWSSSATSRMSR
ncbi:MAG: lactate racemase domain-containing protein [Planctomycetota bacterium]